MWSIRFVISLILFHNNAYGSPGTCKVIRGILTFKHSRTDDFVEVPPTKQNCSTVGGKKSQESCEFCFDEKWNNSNRRISQMPKEPVDKEKEEKFISSRSSEQVVLANVTTSQPFTGSNDTANTIKTNHHSISLWLIIALLTLVLVLVFIFIIFTLKRKRNKIRKPVQEVQYDTADLETSV